MPFDRVQDTKGLVFVKFVLMEVRTLYNDEQLTRLDRFCRTMKPTRLNFDFRRRVPLCDSRLSHSPFQTAFKHTGVVNKAQSVPPLQSPICGSCPCTTLWLEPIVHRFPRIVFEHRLSSGVCPSPSSRCRKWQRPLPAFIGRSSLKVGMFSPVAEGPSATQQNGWGHCASFEGPLVQFRD